MKEQKMYYCDKCGHCSPNRDEVFEHEAAHFGMTPSLIKEYKRLQLYVHRASCLLSNQSNELTRNAYDQAIKTLMDFEVEHAMSKEAIIRYTIN